jgi:hypothetical protein
LEAVANFPSGDAGMVGQNLAEAFGLPGQERLGTAGSRRRPRLGIAEALEESSNESGTDGEAFGDLCGRIAGESGVEDAGAEVVGKSSRHENSSVS